MTVTGRQRLWYILGDAIACAFATLIFNVIRHRWLHAADVLDFSTWSGDPHVALGYIAFPAVMIAVFAMLGFYNSPLYKSRYEIVINGALGSIVGALVIYFTIAVNDNFSERSLHYGIILALWGSFFSMIILVRLLVRTILMLKAGNGDDTYNVVVVGALRDADTYAIRLENNNRRMGYHVVGLVSEGDGDDCGKTDFPVLSYDNLEQEISKRRIKAFVVLASRSHQERSIEVLNKMYTFGCTILLPIDFYNLITTRPKLTNIIGEPLVDITSPALSPAASNFKRLGDILFSAVAMVILSPLALLLACMVKWDSKGPVFYRQERIGYHRRKFTIFKFRSMIVGAESDGPALSNHHDKRVTRLGKVMRKYRLDEIPQFWNVFRGDMSLVGPRPEREYFLSELARREPAIFTLHNVRPGLTSLGVIKCGYASDIKEMTERLYFDLLYVENISLSLDLRIMFHTVNTVLTGKGI